MRGLHKNDCQSSAQSIKIASIGEKPPNPACCLVCCPCLLYNKEFPPLSGGRDLHAGSAATATGSGLYWYLSLKYFLSPAKQCVCNVCFSELGLICLSMIMSVCTHMVITSLAAIRTSCLLDCLQNRLVSHIFLWWNIVFWWLCWSEQWRPSSSGKSEGTKWQLDTGSKKPHTDQTSWFTN